MREQVGRLRITTKLLLGLVVVSAVHAWLFRQGVLVGIVGLAVSKHLAIAWICRATGVDRDAVATAQPHGRLERDPLS